jgi:LAO/AO transport system kinase
LWTEVGEGLIAALKAHPAIVADLPDVERKVADGVLPPTIAARRLINLFARA